MLPMMKRNTYLPSIFDEFFESNSKPVFDNRFTSPKINVIEGSEFYDIELAAPGFEKDDFNVEVKDDLLTINATKSEDKEEEDKNYKRREFRYSSFSRSFILSELIDSEKLEAEYKKGILNIHIPKKEEAKEKPARMILIK